MIKLLINICEDIFDNRMTEKEKDDFLVEKFTNTFNNKHTQVKDNLIAEAVEEYKNSQELQEYVDIQIEE